ncbi:MAG TPA: NEW3 domain-containing protein, partial [Candidatus Limnocylindrales bacterium]|nr:NEW3 domain-containing protein [Candidatus Limnocylindrales bacterium]
MSDRASGNPGSVRPASRVALVLGLLAVIAGPLAPLTAAAGGVTVTTPFPAVVAEPGSTASFDIVIEVDSDRVVGLEADGLPSGWTARFRGGGLTIDSAFVAEGSSPEITLDVEIPDGAAAGTTELRVVATGAAGDGGGRDVLPLSIRVADAAAGDVTLTSDFPELQGQVDTTFTYNVTVTNDTVAETTFTMTAAGPVGWSVEAKPSGQAQATTLTVDPGGTGTITVTATPALDAQAGTYPIQLAVSGGGKDATIDLAATITGTYTLVLSTPDQVLSTTANAGTAKAFALTLTNTGSAAVTGVTMRSSAPTSWTVEFEPETIPAVEPGTPVTITATITPSGDAIA